MTSNIIPEFIRSLDEEIESIKKGNGGSTVKIFNGRFLRKMSGLSIYEFNLENILVVLDESPADIEIRGKNYPAQVLLSKGLELEIGIENYDEEFIPEARLRTNLWYILELLKKKYIECQDGIKKVDFNLSEAIFTSTQLNLNPTNLSEPQYSPSTFPPNEAQKKAIKSSFSSQLAIIWGPPGTGKTKTIATAIEAHLNAGRRVLLVSHANNAVDEALEDVAAQLKATSFYQEGKLVRLGKPQEEHLKILEKDYELVLLDKIAEKHGATLNKEKDDLEREKAYIENKLDRLESIFLSIQTLKTLLSDLNTLNSKIMDIMDKLASTKSELTQLEEKQRVNKEKLSETIRSGKLKRIFKGLDPDKIQREINKTNKEIDAKENFIEELETIFYDLTSLFETKGRERKKIEAEVSIHLKELGMSVGDLESQKKEFEQRKDIILSKIAEINKLLDELQKKILADARMVATTLTKTFISKQFPDEPFDVLILDESSMAPLPFLYWAISHCREYITIVGDFLQLPPICISEKPTAKKWLGRSIFDVLGILGIKDACNDKRVNLLDTQYRMAPEISAVANRFFYQNKLRDDPSTSNRNLEDGFSKSPLALIETSAMNPWCNQLSSGGRFNLYNALVSATLARKISQNNSNVKIGIVTPYKAQARLINKIAKDWEFLDRVRISTVHRFQGGEEPIIIFDSVEGFGTEIALMLDDQRDPIARLLLNVAITRAKNRFYLVGHTQHLLNSLHSNSSFAGIIRYLYDNAETIGSENLVDNYFATDFEKWAHTLLSTTQAEGEPISGELFTEKNFWPQFIQDIKKVKEKLTILSPFISNNRCSNFMNYFRAMINKGIEIQIYTKPINEQMGRMEKQTEDVIEHLLDIGVKVTERSKMHEKIALLDNSIAWEGSLNILSHRDTKEQMRRFVGQTCIEEIIKNLELENKFALGTIIYTKCPKCGKNRMIVRKNKKGELFLGCLDYPKCNGTKSLNE